MITFMRRWTQFGLLDPKTANAERLILYHDLVLVVIGSVLVLVGWFLSIFLLQNLFFKGQLKRGVKRNEVLEVVWTIAPGFFLFWLGFVSLVNLYSMEVGSGVVHSVEAHGHQWYWDYYYVVDFNSYSKNLEVDLENLITRLYNNERFNLDSFCYAFMRIRLEGFWSIKSESYGILENYLEHGSGLNRGIRNQDVTVPCYLVSGEKNEIKVSTRDVIHSWGVPEFGVKADAIPGRVNSVAVTSFIPGFAFGNCYELCGPNHRMMPIVRFITRFCNLERILEGDIFRRDDGIEVIISKLDEFVRSSVFDVEEFKI